MLYRKNRALPLLFIWLALAIGINAQVPDSQTRARMEREITRLLLKQDVGELANNIARERATGVMPLLRRLSIFVRAGHRARALETLNQLAEAPDLPPLSHRWLVAEAVKEIIGSDELAYLKTYYERIMPTDADNADKLLRLWGASGDTKELDAWLAARVAQHAGWLQWRIFWRTSLGTVGELLDALATDVKAHPGDVDRLYLYLQSNEMAGSPQSLRWLEDIFDAWMDGAAAPRSAYELYELGERLQVKLPLIAVKLFESSLQLPFTERDMQLIRERIIMRISMPPRVRDWDKQLRFWTKRHLAETYKSMNQPLAAQKIIEELVALKSDDIMEEDVHLLAGGIQADSGMRVVETKILNDEAVSRDSAKYWLERARYYTGRRDYDAVMDTYRQALVYVPFKTGDRESVAARLLLLQQFTLFATDDYSDGDGKADERRTQIKEILRREFSSTPPETSYAYGVMQLIIDNESELDDFKDSIFAGEKDLLQRMLATRNEWDYMDERLIEHVVCREKLSPARKAEYWSQLETLAKNGAPSRAYYLAVNMISCNEPRRAIPLLTDYLRRFNEQPGERDESLKSQAVENLFSAYVNAGLWKAAEKLVFEREGLTQTRLLYDVSRIALAAARVGAINDAVRLWRVKSNLDRRLLIELDQLSKTAAREPLRRMYVEMKRKDPLSFVPDAALSILQ